MVLARDVRTEALSKMNRAVGLQGPRLGLIDHPCHVECLVGNRQARPTCVTDADFQLGVPVGDMELAPAHRAVRNNVARVGRIGLRQRHSVTFSGRQVVTSIASEVRIFPRLPRPNRSEQLHTWLLRSSDSSIGRRSQADRTHVGRVRLASQHESECPRFTRIDVAEVQEPLSARAAVQDVARQRAQGDCGLLEGR